MNAILESYIRLEQRFARWAKARQDVRLALVVGSRARETNPGDDWADLDVVIFTSSPAAYEAAGWLETFGEVWAAYKDYIRPEVPEWMVVYAGGLDFDAAIFPVKGPELTVAQVKAACVADVLARGVRVLLDRDSVMPLLPPLAINQPPLPDEAAFASAVHCFWRYVERTAKKLRRGELWMAKALCDGLLKKRILQMAEWHALGDNPAADVWYDGHFLERWTDPRVLDGLRESFAYYNETDIWRALFASMRLYGWLAAETAARMGYVYPDIPESQISRWVHQLYDMREKADS